MLQRIVFKIMPEAASRTLALKAGDVDLVATPLESDAADLKGSADFQVFTPPSNGIWYVYLNTTKGPLKDKRVRQALNYAVDKQGIIDAIVYGFGQPMGSFMPPGIFGYKPVNMYEFNPQKAKQLLKAAGYPKGFKMNLYTASKYNNKITQTVQAFWKGIGVEAEIVNMEYSAWMDYRKKPLDETEMMAHMQYVMINYQEAYLWNWVSFSKGFIPPNSRWNTSGYTTPELENIFSTFPQTIAVEKRKLLYHEFQELTSEASPFIALFTQAKLVAMKKGIDGLWVSPLGTFYFQNVTVQ